MFEGVFTGLLTALMPFNLLMVVLGCFSGTFIGMLPGLGPISAVALDTHHLYLRPILWHHFNGLSVLWSCIWRAPPLLFLLMHQDVQAPW